MNPHVCARCAKCCAIVPGDEGWIFPLFDREVERISSHCGRDDWYSWEENTEDLVQAMQRLFPGCDEQVVARLPIPGRHRRLKADSRGVCVFLGVQGCELPRGVRPAHCSLFPFWVEGRRVTRLVAPECLAMRESGTMAELYATLGMEPDQLRTEFAALLEAWALEGDCGKGSSG